MQVAFGSQSSNPLSHSGMSATKVKLGYRTCTQCLWTMVTLPVQLKPSPSKPSPHVQLKLPSLSVQLALELHGYVSSSHSLTSAEDDNCKNVVSNCRTVINNIFALLYTILTLNSHNNITSNGLVKCLQSEKLQKLICLKFTLIDICRVDHRKILLL